MKTCSLWSPISLSVIDRVGTWEKAIVNSGGVGVGMGVGYIQGLGGLLQIADVRN